MSNVHSLPLPAHSASQALRAHHDQSLSTYWCHLHADHAAGTERPAFTPRLLQQLQRYAHTLIERVDAETVGNAGQRPHLVLASEAPVFSLGGDLEHFARMIRSGDTEGLRRYAHACVDAIHLLHTGLRGRVQTVALIQGDALGGGLELALGCHTVVAEQGVQMGFPESLFGLFPGMGAYPLLIRRVPAHTARKLMLDGVMYSSEQMHAMGLVDVLVPRGEGVHAVQSLVRAQQRSMQARFAVDRVAALHQPIAHEELLAGVDVWVDTAMQIDDRHLRTMDRLLRAQQRALASTAAVVKGGV